VFLPHFEKGAASTVPAIKAEAIKCFTALFRWLGKATEGFIDKLKDLQKKELLKEWEAIGTKPNEFKRLTRTEKEAQKEAAIDEAIAAEENK
jgi:hypothetical protein